MSIGKILIRADASLSLGTGHVMRCLALAQAWRAQGGEAVFVMAESTPAISERLNRAAFPAMTMSAEAGSNRDALVLCEAVRRHAAKWVVVDGYAFDDLYFETLQGTHSRVLLIDDNARIAPNRYVAEVVLNQNLSARAATYRTCSETTDLLLGPKYALLRDEFNRWRVWQRETPEIAKKILVTMGGSDPLNLTVRAIDASRAFHLPGAEVKVVVGGSNPRIAELKAKAGGNCVLVIDSAEMPAMLAWADLAVAAAGSTCWEFCMMGLPAILIDAAENQTPAAIELDRLGIARHIALREATVQRLAFEVRQLAAEPSLRSDMSRAGAALVDGRGAARVAAAMRAHDFHLRPAEPDDARLLFEWANDAAVRRSSFSSSPITWQEHCLWFAQKLAEPREIILMCEADAGTPVGTVRFHESSPGEFQIGVTVSPVWRGRHAAPHLLKKAVRYLPENRNVRRVHAFIKKENTASRRSFESAGFRFSSCRMIDGVEAFHYCLENNVASRSFAVQATARAEAAPCT